jgi:hypothetical protein
LSDAAGTKLGYVVTPRFFDTMKINLGDKKSRRHS